MSRFIFTALLVIYLLLYACKQLEINLGWISSCVADFICLPLILTVVRFIMLKLGVINDDFELTPLMILMATVSFAIVFEWYLPKYSTGHYADFFDIVAYFLGGFLYFIFRKTLIEKQNA